MSIQALGHVFVLKLPATEKWLAVCLANHADPWGDSIFPALDTLEEESGMSRSTIKRAFKELLKFGVIERSAKSTPVSPAFYRIVGVPEPKDPPKSEPSCPHALRRAIIHEFGCVCEYCKRSGSKELGPDGRPWEIDRVVPGKKGGIYAPDNVTLACRFCNSKKRANAAPDGTRTLTDKQRERTVQIDPSPLEEGTGQDDLSEGPTLDGPPVHGDPSGGFALNPEPVFDPDLDPSLNGKAGAPTPPLPPPALDNPDDNIGVITKLAHEAYDLLGPRGDALDLVDTVKNRCAMLRIAYNSAVVRKAVDSAKWQREHATELRH